MMSTRSRFPTVVWAVRKLTGPWARRACIAVVVILLCLTTAARLRSYAMARRIQAVLHGLAEMRIDQTSEKQMLETVPYLTRNQYERKSGATVRRWYYAEISNESDRLLPFFIALGPRATADLAYWLGYRYMSFDARVSVEDGKVTEVRYGLARQWVRPAAVGYVVSAKSVHGFWLPYEHGFEVTSQDDESPKYRAVQDRVEGYMPFPGLHVTFTNDAPPDLTKRAFQLNLSCFWSLQGCEEAREIAPGIWEDAQATQAAAFERVRFGKCPESIIDGRMRYLPDISVLLLEVTGSRRVEINEEGSTTEEWLTDYKLKEVIRGRNFESWKTVRFGPTIPSPLDPTQTIANQHYPETKIGSQVLFFGNMSFDSCRFVPASPAALEIVRKAPMPPKRPEDQIQRGLL
jgi:hypothetical protein